MAQFCQNVVDGQIDEQTKLESEAGRFLASIGFLRNDPQPPPGTSNQFRPTLAVLLMTNRCQLRCVYCYAAAGELPAMDLSEETIKAAIDVVCSNAQDLGAKFFEVSFHGGGEPSLVWGKLQDGTKYARKKPLPARITLTTNGIWSKQQCDWILHNLDGVSLSMDGRPETQDLRRPYETGNGSFQTVWRNMVTMDEYGFEYSIRLTAAEPWDDFPQEIEYLCKETKCKKFHVEPTFHVRRGTHGDPLPGDGQGFIDAYMEAVTIAERAERELVYSGARLGLVTDTFCTAPYQALIVNPLEQLVTCYELAGRNHPMSEISIIGKLQDGQIILDEAPRIKLHHLLGERRSACQDCFCYWSCAGDCYVRALSSPDDNLNYRGERCQINRKLTEALILMRIADGNGVWQYINQVMKPTVTH